jgi:hypothetical protein
MPPTRSDSLNDATMLITASLAARSSMRRLDSAPVTTSTTRSPGDTATTTASAARSPREACSSSARSRDRVPSAPIQSVNSSPVSRQASVSASSRRESCDEENGVRLSSECTSAASEIRPEAVATRDSP